MSDAHDAGYGLIMPFVICRTAGGPHDDEPFVAGYECGRLDAQLEHQRPASLHETFRTDSMPQIDLIAMRHGYGLTSEPSEEYEEWTTVVLTRMAEVETTP